MQCIWFNNDFTISVILIFEKGEVVFYLYIYREYIYIYILLYIVGKSSEFSCYNIIPKGYFNFCWLNCCFLSEKNFY